jgi:UDP-N-acetylmuramoylalanine--D-glutamate ligase
LGGLKKNISFRDLDLPQSVHTVYLFGQDRKKIAEEIAHEDIVIRECLDEIIDEIKNYFSSRNDLNQFIILFSPGCSSFDQYKNFEERGTAFNQLINQALRV